ncbi:hypothetical protein BOTBODRAFT_38903 [Botryobasidium botryosum FD-172 SS1]|uniref:Uncharacterized protein n=1 Tax=Botryobasidium botryosum (strain FD-172 SS1) TaxID=930990 RepID=A0A067LY55_BOTB1|nr:hypothetical protein BOTBODRAFT_38903 [Botryobasidium botryosum FD-172 SS1]
MPHPASTSPMKTKVIPWMYSMKNASDSKRPASSLARRFSRFIDLLKPAVHRWASMELQNASPAEVVQILRFPLPRLEFLRMTRHVYELDTATYKRGKIVKTDTTGPASA